MIECREAPLAERRRNLTPSVYAPRLCETRRALDQLTAAGYEIQREDIRRLSPLGHERITLTGRYHIALTETIRRGDYRPLKTPDLAELASA